MLIFTDIVIEASGCGTRHMLLFHSPRLPGVHYKIETDAGTVRRLRDIIGAEMIGVREALAEHGECLEDDDSDPTGRF